MSAELAKCSKCGSEIEGKSSVNTKPCNIKRLKCHKCKQQRRLQYRANYYARNQDKAKAESLMWYKNNSKIANQKKAEWQRNNKEKRRVYCNRYASELRDNYINHLIRKFGFTPTPELSDLWRAKIELKRLKNQIKNEEHSRNP